MKDYQKKVDEAVALVAGGLTMVDACKQVKVSVPTYYRYHKKTPITVTKLAKTVKKAKVDNARIPVAFMNRNELLELFR